MVVINIQSLCKSDALNLSSNIESGTTNSIERIGAYASMEMFFLIAAVLLALGVVTTVMNEESQRKKEYPK